MTRRPLDAIAAEIHVKRAAWTARLAKRVLDIIGSAIGLLLFAPLMAIIAIVVRLTSKGPAFFVQERCGLKGRTFRFYKFRSMVADADAQKAQLLHLNEMSGPVFKMKCDPRVTRVGTFLRKSSLDELPQLWNVLRGDMSLVGPRPPIPEEVERYTRLQAQRLSVLPGITGMWQVSGRSAIQDFDRWLELDLHYAEQWSLWLDIKILFKTVGVVVRAHGAR